MHASWIRWRIAPPLLALLLIGTLVAVACGGDDNDNDELLAEVSALRTELAQTQEIAAEALLRASLPALEVARFHEIDERVNQDGMVHATDPGFLLRAEQVLAGVAWPDSLKPNVDAFRQAVANAIDPVLDNDPAAAGRPIKIAHAHAHEFDGAVAAFFAGLDGPPPSDFDDDTDHEHEAGDEEDDGDGEMHDDEMHDDEEEMHDDDDEMHDDDE